MALEVDFRKRIPLRRAAVSAKRFKLHDFLFVMPLSPSCRHVPEFGFRVEEEHRIFPDDACWRDDADTLARTRRREEQDVLGAVVKHDVMREGVASADNAIIGIRELRVLDVLFRREICRAVRIELLEATTLEIAEHCATSEEDVDGKGVTTQDVWDDLYEQRIAFPEEISERLVNREVTKRWLEMQDALSEHFIVAAFLSNRLRNIPVANDEYREHDEKAEADELELLFFLRIVQGIPLFQKMIGAVT